MATRPTVPVRDKETGHTYKVSEARYRRTPELWERLDSGKPKTSISAEVEKKKQAASGHPADSNQEES